MPPLRRRWRWMLVIPVLAGGAAAAYLGSDRLDWIAREAREASQNAGLLIREVWVEGRRWTVRSDLVRALAVPVGEPSLFLDLDAVKREVEEIGWVADAQVRVLLPNRLHVALHERVPAAVWQKEGVLYAIEASGTVIGPVAPEDFPELAQLVGEGANTKLAHLEQTLAGRPDLARRMEAAIWVSERRWTLTTDTGARIHLPEQDPAGALASLDLPAGGFDVLDPSVDTVDLRVPGRITVRFRPPPEVPLDAEEV